MKGIWHWFIILLEIIDYRIIGHRIGWLCEFVCRNYPDEEDKMGNIKDELVPMLEGTITNQPCVFGHLVENHSVYCHNNKSPYRKCHCSWYYGRAVSILDKCADEDCKYYKRNPSFSEDIEALTKEIGAEKERRIEAQKEYTKATAAGWLCHRCMNGLPLINKKVICSRMEQKWETKGNISALILPDGTEIDWEKECDFFLDWDKFEKEAGSGKTP